MIYPESIISKSERCYFCGAKPTEVHHIMNGTNLRKKSTKYGLTVHLCPMCHKEVHHNPARAIDLKRIAQLKFEELYGEEKWMEEFHRNYK